MPPATESTILTNFLLAPASLSTILPLPKFTALFPASAQKSPHIKALYRDLQHTRAKVTDTVESNIAIEVKRGNAVRKSVIISRRRDEQVAKGDDEVVLENALFGKTGNLPPSNPHNLASIIPELESAADDVEEEVQRLEEEAERLLAEMNGVVGGLSDLRYGKFENKELVGDVLKGLKSLEKVCDA